MINLREYRQQPSRLADYLPWACMAAPGVILNKDGSFQRTARFCGPDLESSTNEGRGNHRGSVFVIHKDRYRRKIRNRFR